MSESPPPTPLRKYVRAVGPRLRWLLFAVFVLAALLGANSAYLASISLLEHIQGLTYQNTFYQAMFLVHLALGLLLIVPFLVFGVIHMRNAHNRPNRRAVQVGYLLFAITVILLVSGLALMRLGIFEIKDPRLRSPIYWAHVLTPLAAVWLYILHRLAGPRIKWAVGRRWAIAVAMIVGAMVVLHVQDPRVWNLKGPEEGAAYFAPSLARTATGKFIPADKMMLNDYCLRCHEDAYRDWFHSAHHYSSLNNPPYLFSLQETRRVALERDGNTRAIRWCAGCHDLVPFFSGALADGDLDALKDQPQGQAGITCVACHSITHVNSTRGNGDYTIEEPPLYPFTQSTNPVLRYINETLVKAKPELHKRSFLKPVHKSAEFCSSCHKVHIPFELNRYKEFLRGQNHYDGFLLSGVSGHGARSFYYPEVAKQKCADCHMPLYPSQDFAAKYNDTGAGPSERTVHSHMFPGGNTGIAALKGDDAMLASNTAFLRQAARIDIFGIKDGGTIDAPLTAPIRPAVPALEPGHTYLFEVVVRTLGVGHPMTQGTVDSNEVWVDATVVDGDRLVGRSGGLGPHREVDAWAHFLNVYMLDRNGNRVDRRNAQDIFTPLYNHQIPPGAGHVVHYAFTVPEDTRGALTLRVAVRYRKFDAIYMNYIESPGYTAGAPLSVTNDLPIATLCEDEVTFPVATSANTAQVSTDSPIVSWQRWNDYGIGLLLEGDRGAAKGELIQAAAAFAEVEKLGRPDGPINLARVYFKEGRLDDAVAALQRAAAFDPPAPRWTLAWLNGSVNKLAGNFDRAIADFRSIIEDRYAELDRRHFDFSKDYIVLAELGQTLVERAKAERGSSERRDAFLREAAEMFERVLAIDSEDVTAHYNLAIIQGRLGENDRAAEHQRLYERYRVDDNAADRASNLARKHNKAADHAAESIVIYSLQRDGAPELDTAR